MPDETVPTFQYADDHVRLAVDNAPGGVIRVRAAAAGCGATFDLSVVGAQRLTSMLGAAITTAITRG